MEWLRGGNMDLTRNEIEYLIEQRVFNEKHRIILKYRLLDGYTYEKIADLMDMSDRQIKNITYKNLAMLGWK